MSILTGDETGLLKYVCGSSCARYGQQSRDLGIVDIQILTKNQHEDNQETRFLVLRRNSSLEAWKINIDGELLQYDSLVVDVDEPVGILPLIDPSNSHRVMIYGKDGNVCIAQDTGSSLVSLDMRASYPTSWEQSTADDGIVHNNTINVRGPLSAGAACSRGVVLGGRENDLILYDTSTMQPVWQAKNVPHDKLSLRVPVWITAVDFLRPMECDVGSGTRIVTGTGYKHVRIYDTRVSRQPITSFEVSEEYRVTAICPSHDGENVYVGDTAGGLHLWDLRLCRKKNTMKGFAGSIRDIKLSEDGEYLAAVGLDRFARLYSIGRKSPQLENAIYLKNKLTCCSLVDNPNVAAAKDFNKNGDSDVESDVLEELNDSDNENESVEEDSSDDEIAARKLSKRFKKK